MPPHQVRQPGHPETYKDVEAVAEGKLLHAAGLQGCGPILTQSTRRCGRW